MSAHQPLNVEAPLHAAATLSATHRASWTDPDDGAIREKKLPHLHLHTRPLPLKQHQHHLRPLPFHPIDHTHPSMMTRAKVTDPSWIHMMRRHIWQSERQTSPAVGGTPHHSTRQLARPPRRRNHAGCALRLSCRSSEEAALDDGAPTTPTRVEPATSIYEPLIYKPEALVPCRCNPCPWPGIP